MLEYQLKQLSMFPTDVLNSCNFRMYAPMLLKYLYKTAAVSYDFCSKKVVQF